MIHLHIRVAVVALLAIGSSLPACSKPREQAPATSAAPATDPSQHEHHDHAPAQAAEHTQHTDHASHVLPLDAPLAGTSLYHVAASFTDQRGNAFDLASLRGSAVLAAMFYASCKSICPVLISRLKRVDETLAPEVRAQTHVVLISLDPKRDSVAKLQELAESHDITDPRWHFLRASERDVREVAAVLGVRYRSLPDGEISHSPLIALLDRDGAIDTRIEAMSGELDGLIVATTRVVRHGE